jgi:hypothetical protein
MLGVNPPLDGTPHVNANEVLRLKEASQGISEKHGGEVSEIWCDVDGEGSVYRNIRPCNETWNHDLGRSAARSGRKQERQGSPPEKVPAKEAGGHHAPNRPDLPGCRRPVGRRAAFLTLRPSSHTAASSSPWPGQRVSLVNRCLTRREIVLGCMGDGNDTSCNACSGLPLSCDSPLQLYVRNRRRRPALGSWRGDPPVVPGGSTGRGCAMGRKGDRSEEDEHIRRLRSGCVRNLGPVKRPMHFQNMPGLLRQNEGTSQAV